MFTPQILSLVYSCKYYILVASTLYKLFQFQIKTSPKKKKKKKGKRRKKVEVLVWKQRKNNLAPNLWHSLISGTSVRSEPPFFIWSISVSRSSSWSIVLLSLSLSVSLFLFYFLSATVKLSLAPQSLKVHC